MFDGLEKLKFIIINLIIALLYIALAKLGLIVAFSHSSITAIWPPSGLALAALIVFGRQKSLLGILIGAFTVNCINFYTNELNIFISILCSALIAISNTGEALIIHYILNKFHDIKNPLLDKDGMVKLMFTAPVGCLFAALVGPLVLMILGFVDDTTKLESMIWTWWIGDLTGIMVFVPFILVFTSRVFKIKKKLLFEFFLCIASLSTICILVFLPFDIHFLDEKPMIYTLLPFFVWAIYRFELTGAITLLFVLYVFAVLGTINDGGPFYKHNDIESALIKLDLFVIIVSVCAITMARLIENLRRTQQLLFHSSKLAELGQMASGIAHELNNPLNIILGNLKLINDEIKTHHLPLNAKVEESLSYVQRASERMRSTVKNMSDFSRINVYERHRLNLNEIVFKSLALVGNHIEKNQISLDIQIDESRQIYINGDRNRLDQVFVNILMNAKDAVLQNADKKNISVKTLIQDEFAILLIEDTGMGISDENKEKIFDPFYTTKKMGQGTGIGLSISYGIIKEHGGMIEVEDRKSSKGTRFKVKLPLV